MISLKKTVMFRLFKQQLQFGYDNFYWVRLVDIPNKSLKILTDSAILWFGNLQTFYEQPINYKTVTNLIN